MIYLVLLVLGLAFGSFVNALVWRLHEQEKGKGKNADLSIVKGRSMCPNCSHQLEAQDLIPVISWLTLKGKCRYCQKPISAQYPLVELSTALFFVLSYAVLPADILFVIWLPILVLFVALVIYDLRWMLLPNKLIGPLAGLVVLHILVDALFITKDPQVLIEGFWGVIALGGFFYLIFQVSKGRWIGGGDVKLGFVLGLLVGGPLHAMLLMFAASVLGTLVSVPLITLKRVKATSRIPFGPFLITAAILVYLFGEQVVNWYETSVLLT